MKSINVSFAKLNSRNFYEIYCFSNSNITHSIFSNNTSTDSEIHLAWHTGPSDTIEFNIHFCSYFGNSCDYFVYSDYNLNFSNCSFYENTVKIRYFGIRFNKRMLLKGCYVESIEPSKFGTATITESANLDNIDDLHLTTTCIARLLNETYIVKKIKVNNKRNNNFYFLIYLASLYSS